MPDTLSAIVLADGPHADARVVGLGLAERARRVAGRAGAARVLVVRGPTERAALPGWWLGGRLLVIDARAQLVHTPLVAGLPGALADAERAVATVPATPAAADLPPGAAAGAVAARGPAADALLAALARGDDLAVLAAGWLEAGAAAVPHGEVARHPAATRDERRAAARLLYRITVKPQDNAITRYLYRPISSPMTRLAVHTPITPNQVSYLVAVLVGIGVWLTARGPMGDAIAGTALILFASYVDCVDGEVARLKLVSSKFGAWLDTVIDELSSVAQMVAIGVHCQRWFGPGYLGDLGFDPWAVGIGLGVATYALTIYAVYYNLIVVVGSANSQDYVGEFEVAPGEAPGTVVLRPAATQAIATDGVTNPVLRWVLTYLPYLARRDLITWGLLGLAAAHLTQVAFGLLVLGGVVSGAIVGLDHLRLRRQIRAVARQGLVLARR